MSQQSIPATLFRGGTSKGVYFERSAMPADREAWDTLLLETFGSPDPMQLDGVGGSHSTTSKALIVSSADSNGSGMPEDTTSAADDGNHDIDVEYLFGQVCVEKPVVDWGGNCGNLTFAVGPFALERGLATAAPPEDGRTELVLRNVNTGVVVEQSIPVDAGKPDYTGDFKVHGVPATGSRIRSRFLGPSGAVTGEMFPTGERSETIDVPDVGDVEVSLVDVSSPCVFAHAADLGMTATELPETINVDEALLTRLERVRSAACERYGFVNDAATATATSPGIPKMAVVGDRQEYETVGGDHVASDEYDLLVRIMSMQKAHHAYAVTGAMCTAVAAALPGTVPNEYLDADRPDRMVLGHPKGTMGIGVGLNGDVVTHTTVNRTARQLMHGDLYYPEN